MIPLSPDPVIGAETAPFEDECAEDDWDCNQTPWHSFITESFRRLVSADYSNFNGDFAISLVFLALCIGSWQFVQFVFQKLVEGKNCYQNDLRELTRRNRGPFGANINDDSASESEPTMIEAEEHQDTDVRAAGDSWEQDEYDPDYDANNEIMVMLLQDQEDADDITTLRSEAEQEEILEELTRPEDEVQLIEIQNEANDTVDLLTTTPTAESQQEEDRSNSGQKESVNTLKVASN